MTHRPWFQPVLAGLFVIGVMLCTAPWVEVGITKHPDPPGELLAFRGTEWLRPILPSKVVRQFWPSVLFGVAAATMVARLRQTYPSVVSGIAVAALLTLPQVFVAGHKAANLSLASTGVLILWSSWPIVRRGIVGIVIWLGLLYFTWMVATFGVTTSKLQLSALPEWHAALAIVGAIAAVKRRDSVALGLVAWIVAVGMLVEGPARVVLLAPLAAIGAGRLLFRGTLTHPCAFRPQLGRWC